MRNQSMFDKIKSAVEKAKNGTPANRQDENVWKLEGDKAKNGSAVIRFLPGVNEETMPFVKVYNHGFQGPTGKWFIEDCPTSIGGECPVCVKNSEYWNSGIESDKEIVRKRKRKTKYISNILVVSDPKNPDNEGKVMLFSYGQKIFDKISEVMSPQDEDETPINPFDLYEGANFKLNMTQVGGYANFDKSKFAKITAIGNDAEIDAILAKLHDLSHYVDPKNFKSAEDLKKRYAFVVGDESVNMSEDDQSDRSYVEKVVKNKPAPVETPTVSRTLPEDDDDDMMAEFQRLAED